MSKPDSPSKSLTVASGCLTLVGLPNAGKSSLLNKLVGADLAIVTPKAQTTRRSFRGFLSAPGLECVVMDTPGLQEGTKSLNQALAKSAGWALKNTEALGIVVDAAEIGRRIKENKPTALDVVVKELREHCAPLPISMQAFVLLNKKDLVRKEIYRAEVEAHVQRALGDLFKTAPKTIWISAREGNGIEELNEALRETLPQGQSGELFDLEALSDQNLREFVSEYIREQCFMQLGEELPYAIAIQIENFDEKSPTLTKIEASIFVERDSQRIIVIGSKGSKLKNIGTKAREKIEKLLEKKVFLSLKVKVAPHWSRKDSWVERFGYGNPT